MPGMIIYKDGDIVEYLIPALDQLGGNRVNLEIVEYVLSKHKITETEAELDPREMLMKINIEMKKGKRRHGEDLSDSEDEGRGYMHTGVFGSY